MGSRKVSDLLTVNQVAEQFRVTAKTVRNWIREKTILAIDVSSSPNQLRKRHRIPPSEVKRMMKVRGIKERKPYS